MLVAAVARDSEMTTQAEEASSWRAIANKPAAGRAGRQLRYEEDRSRCESGRARGGGRKIQAAV